MRRPGSERTAPAPRSDAARLLVGATEVLLLARDPHLAARAAWLLLRSADQPDEVPAHL